jgi:hypothetical protein
MRVPVEIEEIELDGDHAPVPSIQATCQRCGHETQSFGTSEKSVKRCLVLLRKECRNEESNFYVASEEDES